VAAVGQASKSKGSAGQIQKIEQFPAGGKNRNPCDTKGHPMYWVRRKRKLDVGAAGKLRMVWGVEARKNQRKKNLKIAEEQGNGTII